MGEAVGAPKDRARYSRASIHEWNRLGSVELHMNGALRASYAMSDVRGPAKEWKGPNNGSWRRSAKLLGPRGLQGLNLHGCFKGLVMPKPA